jgi:hypothetical protein
VARIRELDGGPGQGAEYAAGPGVQPANAEGAGGYLRGAGASRPDVTAPDAQTRRLKQALEELRRLDQSTNTELAEALEARRIAAEADIRVPTETGEIGARDLLDAAEAEAAEALAAAACLVRAAA